MTLSVRRPYLVLGIVAALFAASTYVASQLSILSDFKVLIPEHRQSVINLNKIIDRVGGVSNLVIGVESPDVKASQRFIDAAVTKLKAFPPEELLYVEYNIRETRKYFEDRKYLYADLQDLREIEHRIRKRIDEEKLRANPLYFSIEDSPPTSLDFSDLEAKYKGMTSGYTHFTDGYFFGPDQTMAAIIIRPAASSTSTSFSKSFIEKVKQTIRDLNPQSYHPDLKIHYTGKFKATLDEYQQLIFDMLETLALCLVLVALIIYLYFKSIRVIFLLFIPLLVGTSWTMALTKLAIGYLNSQTAFLGSIIIGNGVNNGIILLARYLEERRKGLLPIEAMKMACQKTWLATLIAAATTSVAFAALGISEIKGLSQFGFVGGIGMILVWSATYLSLPALMLLSERVRTLPTGKQGLQTWEFATRPMSHLVCQHPGRLLTAGVLLAGLGIALAINFLPHSLEYDFSKLRNKVKRPKVGKSINQRIDDIFGDDLSPVVILLDRPEQTQGLCAAIFKREEQIPQAQRLIGACKTLQDFLPTKQPEKLKVLKRINQLLSGSTLALLNAKQREEVRELKKHLSLREMTLAELPESVSRNFREKDGTLGRMVFVYPSKKAKLTDGRVLARFVALLTDLRLNDGGVVTMSGESAIFADLLKAIAKDGPRVTTFSFILVAILVWIQFRRLALAGYVLGGLALTLIYLLGALSLFKLKLNFFNFIALPVTFGVGVDYGVNLLQRYRDEGHGRIKDALHTVGGAILLCSMTTIIGYSTLVTAMNQALVSFGWLSLIGEFASLTASLLMMPACLKLWEQRQAKKGTLAET